MEPCEYLEVEAVRYLSAVRPSAVNGEPLPSADCVSFPEYLEQLDREGWELVDAASEQDVLRFIFKRPIQSWRRLPGS